MGTREFPCDVTERRRGCRSQVAGRSFVGLSVARGFAFSRAGELHLTFATDFVTKIELAARLFIVVAVD